MINFLEWFIGWDSRKPFAVYGFKSASTYQIAVCYFRMFFRFIEAFAIRTRTGLK